MPILLGPRQTSKYLVDKEENVPWDIQRRRRYVYDALRRVGNPVLIRHRYSDEDLRNGTATNQVITSPARDTIYGQTSVLDPLSFGTGYMSVELSPDEWYSDTTGEIIVSVTNPGSGYTQAPMYRGFGPGSLTYIVEPDRAQDYFVANSGGPVFKVQSATAIAPWYPKIRDGDLLINVTIDKQGNILSSQERYEAHKSMPISMRGLDRRGNQEKQYDTDGGNRFLINQQFEMNALPENNRFYEVEIDR